MTRMTTALAVAADYADALMTARRAKNWLFILVLLLLLVQLIVFVLARFDVLKLNDESAATATTLPTFEVMTSQPTTPMRGVEAGQIIRYVTPVIDFAIIGFSIVLTIVMLLLVTIMLVGRLIGVSQVTSAFIWGVLLLVLLFPWQTFLIGDDVYPVSSAGPAASSTSASSIPEQPAFKWPGAIYTYAELKRDHKFPNLPKTGDTPPKNELALKIFGWGRFVGLPVLAIILLLIVQLKSSRGLRQALGEADVQLETPGRGPEGTIMAG